MKRLFLSIRRFGHSNYTSELKKSHGNSGVRASEIRYFTAIRSERSLYLYLIPNFIINYNNNNN